MTSEPSRKKKYKKTTERKVARENWLKSISVEMKCAAQVNSTRALVRRISDHRCGDVIERVVVLIS